MLVQDLIILSKYQNRGIGSVLFEKIMDKFKNVKTFIVITDIQDKKNQVFYQKFGMKKLEACDMIGYIG